MKRFYYMILSVLTAVFVPSVAQNQNSYKVDFYIHEMDDSLIYVEGYCGSKTEIMDSVFIAEDGGFHLSAVDYPMGMYMVKSTKGELFSFVLEKSKQFSIEVYPNGEFFIKNSPENDAYFLYQKENKQCKTAMYYYKINAKKQPEKADSLRQDILAVIDSFEVFQKQFFAAYPDNIITVVNDGMNQTAPSYFFENGMVKEDMQQQYAYYYRTHYWDRFHFGDGRILYTPYFMSQFNTYINEITMQDPDTVCLAIDEFINKADANNGKEYADYIIAWYLDYLPQLPFSFNEMLYSHIVSKYLNRASTYLLPSTIEFHRQNTEKISPFLPGKPMPNVIFKDFEGIPHSLYSVKSKYTVLYFFSSLCENCKKNLDDLKNFYAKHKDDYDAEIYSVDIEPDYAICKARQEADPYPWIVVHASADELQPYNFNLTHTPALYVLDEKKKIINKTAIYKHIEQSIANDIKSKNKK